MIAVCVRNSTTVIRRSGSEAAAASPRRGGNWNRLQIFVVMVSMPAGSARIAGVPKSVIDCRKAMRKPASSAGTASGSVMCIAVRHAGAPRMAEASSSSLGMTSRLLATKVKTYGKV